MNISFWVKANTNGSIITSRASCGGILCDYRSTFLGCFSSNLGRLFVFEAELMGLILTMKFAAQNKYHMILFLFVYRIGSPTAFIFAFWWFVLISSVKRIIVRIC